jgi:hypothetical protein
MRKREVRKVMRKKREVRTLNEGLGKVSIHLTIPSVAFIVHPGGPQSKKRPRPASSTGDLKPRASKRPKRTTTKAIDTQGWNSDSTESSSEEEDESESEFSDEDGSEDSEEDGGGPDQDETISDDNTETSSDEDSNDEDGGVPGKDETTSDNDMETSSEREFSEEDGSQAGGPDKDETMSDEDDNTKTSRYEDKAPRDVGDAFAENTETSREAPDAEMVCNSAEGETGEQEANCNVAERTGGVVKKMVVCDGRKRSDEGDYQGSDFDEKGIARYRESGGDATTVGDGPGVQVSKKDVNINKTETPRRMVMDFVLVPPRGPPAAAYGTGIGGEEVVKPG